MKRALIVGTGTVMGVAAVLALNPDGTSVAAGLPTSTGSSTGSTSAGPASGGSGSAASPKPASGSSGSAATSATGTGVDVGYGIVQVKVTLTGGKITAIDAVQLPQNDGHSARISQQAWPMLVDQALKAQSSQIAGISGASYTSAGFTDSLKAALVSLGHAA